MKYQRWLVFALSALVIPGCAAWIRTCPQLWPCLSAAARPDPRSAFLPSLLLVGGSLLWWSARTSWLLAHAAREVARLPRRGWPTALRQAVRRTGVQRVECFAGEIPLAFCTGALRPRILVSRRLVRRLRSDEMDAVLLHEHHHGQRLEPLRRAARQAAAEVCFYVPLLRWWANRRHERSELDADRAALQRVGPQPLAGALWVMGTAGSPEGVAAFPGATELRVAQVLGEPLPPSRPEPALWTASGMGLLLAVGFTWCLAQMFGI